ncbi:MAG TPA: response regulator [Actinomycetota bacterium]|nr:response regulator [Actinomycetota bacterium]
MSQRQRHLLIADDEPDIRFLLKRMLDPIGYQVTEASNGEEVLDHARRSRPDLILLDLKMPVMDGFECLEKLKGDPALRAVPVVVVTAWGELLEGEPAMAWAEACVAKPFTADVLLRIVDEVLARPRPG